jgi:hypothetical protein
MNDSRTFVDQFMGSGHEFCRQSAFPGLVVQGLKLLGFVITSDLTTSADAGDYEIWFRRPVCTGRPIDILKHAENLTVHAVDDGPNLGQKRRSKSRPRGRGYCAVLSALAEGKVSIPVSLSR